MNSSQQNKILLVVLLQGILTTLPAQQNNSLYSNEKPMQLSFTAQGGLDLKPANSSSANDFDFLQGQWNIRNKKLKSRLTHSDEWIEFDATGSMDKVLAGTGNVDRFCTNQDGRSFEGMTLRLFNPATRLWSIHWAASNTGTLDNPVVGSFEDSIGTFYCKDMHDGKNVLCQFRWDATDPDNPVWSQALSDNNGETWEWNWYMYFSRPGFDPSVTAKEPINVIELRNYRLRPGQREQFVWLFDNKLTNPQKVLGGMVLGHYKVKESVNNFFWIRGFENMKTRTQFLPEFYSGEVWKQNRNAANAMLLNNDDVYLLAPLSLKGASIDLEQQLAQNSKGIVVVDYYRCNEKLSQFIGFYRSDYLAILTSFGVTPSLWVSESIPNDFKRLPVFQDRNLLVAITFFKDENEYQAKLHDIGQRLTESQRNDWQDLVTSKSTLILYPDQRPK